LNSEKEAGVVCRNDKGIVTNPAVGVYTLLWLGPKKQYPVGDIVLVSSGGTNMKNVLSLLATFIGNWKSKDENWIAFPGNLNLFSLKSNVNLRNCWDA
jgi:hypothetical protein